MKKVYYLILCSICALFLTNGTVNAQSEDNIMPGELIVQLTYQQDINEVVGDLNKQNPNLGLEVNRVLSNRINIWLLDFDDLSISNNEALNVVSRHLKVAVAQYNHTDIVLRDTLPNDPQVNQQWAFWNTDTTGANGNAGISAQKAWDITTGGTTSQGDEIVMAVIDGGFDVGHEDIVFWTNTGEIAGNGIDDDGNGYTDDVNGWNAYSNSGNITSSSHGTHVAGTVAANGNNGIGVTGVNWHGTVMAIQGSSGNEATVVAAYGFALDNRYLYRVTNGAQGAFVVSTNSSFGVDNANPNSYPIWCNFYDSLGAEGIISCGATANNNVNIDQVGDVPTACPSDWLISVTNTDDNDNRAFAGYGATTIDLAAPGSGILSTYPNDNYNSISGTSMATPHVAGTVGLMISAGCPGFIDAYKQYPDSMALVIIDMILDNVDPVAGLSGECVTGGRLNLYKSVKAVADWSCTPIVLGMNSTDATCGNSDGSATVSATGNVGPIVSYMWDDPSMQTGATATGLAAGTYNVVVTDSAGNMNNISVTIINGNEPTVNISSVDPDCWGETDGEATANVTGGTPSFSYLWDDPMAQTTQTATGLGAGTYNVVVSDGANCVVTQQVEITTPGNISISSGVTANTADPANGSIQLTIGGGTPPYSFDWSNGATTEDLSGLFQGQYTLIVTDANGCTRADTFNVGGNIGIGEFGENMQLEIFPNPSNGQFQVSFVEALPSTYTLELVSAVGQIVTSEQLVVNSSAANIVFDIEDAAQGLYYLRVSDLQERSAVLKLVIR